MPKLHWSSIGCCEHEHEPVAVSARKGLPVVRKALLAGVSSMALALGVAACGDDTDSGKAPAAGGRSEIALAADPGGDLAFDRQALSANAGKVTLTFTNDSSVPHNVEIDAERGEEAGVTETITATKTTKQFDLELGSYEYYCTIGSHKDAGMEGELTVK